MSDRCKRRGGYPMARLMTWLMLVLALAFFGGGPARAASWVVDPARSQIQFAGEHMGKAFTGRFGTWSAAIDFDPAKPEASVINVVIDLASARTGDATYDKTLPTSDWFDTARTPRATFKATKVRATASGAYVADGTLAMRGVAVPVTLPFKLAIKGDVATMSGQVTLKRTDWGIGKASDAGGDWVSLAIPVRISVVARRKG